MKKKLVLTVAALVSIGLLTSCSGKNEPKASSQPKESSQSQTSTHNHTWGEVTYVWANDNSTCTAKRVCKDNQEHVETETVNSTYAVVEAAKCESDGKGRFTADFKTNEAFKDQTKDIKLEATNHTWGEVTYTWNKDSTTCTASKVCSNDSSHKVEETAHATKVVRDATEEDEGLITYTAEFTTAGFAKQVKTETTPVLPALSKLDFIYHAPEFANETAYYSVKAKSTAISGKVAIPSTYKGESDLEEVPVTAFETEGFRGCEEITYVDIPSSIEVIGSDRVFANCSKIATLILHEGTQAVSRRAFQYCIALTSVYFPKSIISTGNQGFQFCESIESVTFAEDSELTVLESQTFASCKKLKEIHVPSKVTETKTNALSGCTSLEKVTLPKGLTKIGARTFFECSNLTAVDFGGTKEEWNNIEKGTEWMNDSAIKTIRCADGDVTL